MAAKKKNVQYIGLGRRKSSVARVILVPGKGEIIVNGTKVEEYMPYPTLVKDLKQPLTLTGTEAAYDCLCNVRGGGFSGQTGAIRLGIARALLGAGEFRAVLKKAGMLSRDSRVKERKKYGLKGARRAPQFSKR